MFVFVKFRGVIKIIQIIENERNNMLFRYSKCMLLVVYCVFVFFPSNAANDESIVWPAIKTGLAAGALVAAPIAVLNVVAARPFLQNSKSFYDMCRADERNARASIEVDNQVISLLDATRVGRQETGAAVAVAENFDLGCPDIDGVIGDYCADPGLRSFNDNRLQQVKSEHVARQAVQRRRARIAHKNKQTTQKNCAFFIGRCVVGGMCTAFPVVAFVSGGIIGYDLGYKAGVESVK